ncbi:N-acetyltransferase 8-like 2 [Diretmus argenteus]
MQLVIRRYHPSDKDTVQTLFSDGILEHIGPSFYSAMTSPLYLGFILVLCAAGFLLDSVLGALVLLGGWVGLVYYCCHEIYSCYVREKLRTDMQDIPGNYLTRPDDHFWVAEAEINGKSQVIGMVAVVAKQSGKEMYGELFRMIISSSCRQAGLGSRMAQTVIDFCKERGFSRVVLETSSTQTAAVALYKKMGFTHVIAKTTTQAPDWLPKVARVKILRMEKRL